DFDMAMKAVGEVALSKTRLMPGNVVAACSASGGCRKQAALRLCALHHCYAYGSNSARDKLMVIGYLPLPQVVAARRRTRRWQEN
ncbi:MAG: hypothetical protein ABIV36_23910, partial [Sphingobium limneticum]